MPPWVNDIPGNIISVLKIPVVKFSVLKIPAANIPAVRLPYHTMQVCIATYAGKVCVATLGTVWLEWGGKKIWPNYTNFAKNRDAVGKFC